MDGVQVGHYLDNVFAFRAELALKIVLGEVAAEAGFCVAGGRSGGPGWAAEVREHVRDRPVGLRSPP